MPSSLLVSTHLPSGEKRDHVYPAGVADELLLRVGQGRTPGPASRPPGGCIACAGSGCRGGPPAVRDSPVLAARRWLRRPGAGPRRAGNRPQPSRRCLAPPGAARRPAVGYGGGPLVVGLGGAGLRLAPLIEREQRQARWRRCRKTRRGRPAGRAAGWPRASAAPVRAPGAPAPPPPAAAARPGWPPGRPAPPPSAPGPSPSSPPPGPRTAPAAPRSPGSCASCPAACHSAAAASSCRCTRSAARLASSQSRSRPQVRSSASCATSTVGSPRDGSRSKVSRR